MHGENYTVEELKKLNVSLHWLYRRRLLEGQGVGKFNFPDNYLTLWLVEDGEVSVETEGKGKIVVSSGQWFVCSQGVKRVQKFAPDAKIISLWFDIHYEDHGQPVFSNLPLVFEEARNASLKNLCLDTIELLQQSGVRTIAQLGQDRLQLSDAVKLQTKTMELFCELMQTLLELGCELKLKKPIDSRVSAAMLVLSDLGYTGTIPYGDLRIASGLSRVQLDRLFVKELGMTPKDYLGQKCVHAAFKLLSSGNYTVKEVAYRLNFMNSAHFCTWFKRQTGLSPKKVQSEV